MYGTMYYEAFPDKLEIHDGSMRSQKMYIKNADIALKMKSWFDIITSDYRLDNTFIQTSYKTQFLPSYSSCP